MQIRLFSPSQRASAVKTQDSYSFPLYHRLGAALHPIIASRYWIVIVLVLALLLYLPFLFAGFFQDDYGMRLQFSDEAYEKLGVPQGVPKDVILTGPLNLYGFSSGPPEAFALQRDKGFAPWWADENIKTNFFRPLSSLTLALDYSLWPELPLLMHLHSLLWFALLLVLTYRLYRGLSGSAVVAGVSILLLVVDDVFAGPAGWISNRHALIAMVFGVLAIWLYHQGISQKRWTHLIGAYIAYAVALLASEMGLVTFAYLFAYLLVLDRDRWSGRIARILPFVAITVVWRLVYTWLGYGATGTLLYVDPILNPFGFATQAISRFPILLFSAFGLPLADIIIAFSARDLLFIAALVLIPLALLALIVYPVLKTHRTAAFWLIGLLGAAIPLVSGIPGNRNLGFVSVGVMGLAGQFLVDVAAMPKPAPLNRFRLILLKLATTVLLILFLGVAPVSVLNNPSTTRTMSQDQAQVANFGTAPELAQQHVYVINPPCEMIYIAGMLQRLFTDEPIPASINYLAPGFTPVHIDRLDARTIRVTPESGYTPPLGPMVDETSAMVNVYRALEQNYYNPRNPMHVGQVVTLSEFTVEVTEMTGDGRIAQAVFTFDYPLEDDRYVWLLWHESASTYETVHMPPVGESSVFQ